MLKDISGNSNSTVCSYLCRARMLPRFLYRTMPVTNVEESSASAFETHGGRRSESKHKGSVELVLAQWAAVQENALARHELFTGAGLHD